MRTAALLIIGNEILSGKTQDKNLAYIAKKLADMGIRFKEVRVVEDIEDEIGEALNALRTKFDYVFTTGGIGPTHDDITTESVAKAMSRKVIHHPDAVAALEKYYANRDVNLNQARLKMATTPEGATLIDNPLTAAPGYKIENVFVLAGIPSIMQVMFDYASQFLEGGQKILSHSVSCNLVEGNIAEGLTAIANENSGVDIGSYPFVNNGGYAVTLVARGVDKSKISICIDQIKNLILSQKGAIIAEEVA